MQVPSTWGTAALEKCPCLRAPSLRAAARCLVGHCILDTDPENTVEISVRSDSLCSQPGSYPWNFYALTS